MFYNHFISFLVLTYDIVPSARCCFLLVFYITGSQYQMESKRSETFCGFFLDQKTQDGTKKYQRGAPRGAQPTRARLGPQARPGGLCPPWGTPLVLLWPILCLLVQKKSPKSFAAFGLRLVLISCDVENMQKTTTGTWHYVNRLVPKNDIK